MLLTLEGHKPFVSTTQYALILARKRERVNAHRKLYHCASITLQSINRFEVRLNLLEPKIQYKSIDHSDTKISLY